MYSSSEIADHLDGVLGEYRVLERRLSSVLGDSGLSVDAWRVLRLVQRSARVTMKEVLDSTGLPPASATRAVDVLVSLGYVFRRSDEADRRSVQVSPSAEGTAALGEIETTLSRVFADALD